MFFPVPPIALRLCVAFGAALVLGTCSEAPPQAPGDVVSARAPAPLNTFEMTSALTVATGVDCCCTQDGPSCGSSACIDCACKKDPHCCEAQWDLACVALAENECANKCQCPDSPSSPLCGSEPSNICVDGDGTSCDDGDRCTSGDECFGSACLPNGETSCDDSDDCTTDSCAPAGCIHKSNVAALCKRHMGVGLCGQATCLVSACAIGYLDKDGNSPNGCEYRCVGAAGTTETCNDVDDNCNGQTDEGCSPACAGSEQPDDGVDTDCDGHEKFGGPNALKLQTPIPAGAAFSTSVSGKFHMGLLGVANVTGTLSRTSGTAAVSWCVSGNVSVELPYLKLAGATATVCRSTAGIETATLEGIGLVGGIPSVHVTGTFTTGDAPTLSIDVPNLKVAQNVSLTAAKLEYDGGDVGGEPWKVAVSGSLTAGPFTAVVQGDLQKTDPAAPLTGCLTGTTTGAVLGLEFPVVALTACVGEQDGEPIVTSVGLHGVVQIEGQSPTFRGDVTLGAAWNVHIAVAGLEVVPGLIHLDEVHLSVGKGQTSFALTAGVTLEGVAAGLKLSVSGAYKKTSDLTLNFIVEPGSSWKPFGSLPITLGAITGRLQRQAGIWKATVSATAPSVVLAPALTVTNVTAGVTVATNTAWSLRFSGDATVGPFSTFLNGTMSRTGAGAPLVVSLRGSATGTIAGIGLTNVTLEVKKTGGAPFTASITCKAGLEGQNTTLNGTLTLGTVWSLSLTVTRLGLGPHVRIRRATLTATKGGSTWTLSGKIQAGVGSQQLVLDVTGAWLGAGNMALTVSLPAGKAWKPIAQIPFEVTALSGQLLKVGSAWSLSVTASSMSDISLDGAVSLTSATLTASLSSGGAWSFSLGGTGEVGLFGQVSIDGVVTKQPGNPPTGCLSGSADRVIQGVPFTDVTLSACIVDDDCGGGTTCLKVSVGATIQVGQETFPVTATLSGPTLGKLTLTVADLDLGPGFEVDPATLVFTKQSLTLTGTLKVGKGTQAATLSVDGAFSNTGNFDLDLQLAEGTTWRPIPGHGLTLDDVSGHIVKQGGTTSLALTASLNTFTPVAGLTLADVTFTGSVDSTGDFEIAISATLDIVAGPFSITVEVTASIDNTGTFRLEGALPENLAPVPSLAQVFSLDSGSAFVQVVIPTGAFSIGFGATASVCLFPPCSESQDTEIEVDGGVVLPTQAPGGPSRPHLPGGSGGDAAPGSGGGAGVWLRGALLNTNLPFLGNLAGGRIVLSSIDLPDFDVFKTPGNLLDDLDVPPGVSLFALAPTPIPIGNTRPEVLFGCSITTSSFKVSASVDGEWKIIKPSSNFAGVESLTLTSMYIEGDIAPPSGSLKLGAEVVFLPDNQTTPLLGTAELGLEADAGILQLTMNLGLLGRWYDVLGLTGFALQNPAFTLDILLTSTPPVPSSLGFNGDLFWRKSGATWPSLTQWPIPDPVFDPNNPPPPPPASVAQIGGTFYTSAEPSPSGLCLFGACAPLPPFLLRMQLANLKFPGDIINIHNALFVSLQGFLPGSLPTLSLPTIDTSPLAIGVNKLTLYASTHSLDLFGIDWKPGFMTELDVEIGTTDVRLLGFADTKGLIIEGSVEPIDLFGLDLVNITGDPFRHYAKLDGLGYISVDDRPRLDLPEGTVEGWIKLSTINQSVFSHTLASKEDGLSGWSVSVGAPLEGKGRVSMRFRGGGSERVWTTDAGVVPTAKWVHVAAAFNGSKAGITIDGVRVPASVTGAEAFTPAFNDAPVLIGKGCQAVDDVRLWTKARTRARIKGDSRFLDYGYHNDSDLVARYEFDLDPDNEDGLAHNSRYYSIGSRMHGVFAGGAKPVLDTVDQDLRFKLALRVPGSDGSDGGPGFWMQAGARLDVPFIDTDLVGGVQVAIGGGEASGTLFVKDFNILPVGFGTFIAGGYGPNLVPGDFDDGLLATIDLLGAEFAATGKVAFQGNNAAKAKVLGGASVTFLCPNEPCSSPLQHELTLAGDMDLTTALPLGLGDIGILGEFDATLNNPNWFIDVEGSLLLFGLELLSGSIEINRNHIQLTTVIDFGTLHIVGFKIDLGGLVMNMELNFDDFRLCGSGSYTSNPDKNHDGNFQCGVSICIDGEGFPLTPSLGCGDFCLGSEFCPDEEVCIFARCKPRLLDGKACGKDKHCLSESCGCIADDTLGISVGVCYSAGSQSLGDACKVDAECAIGRCSGEACFTGKCVCVDDQDCGSGMYCDQGVVGNLGTNSCKPLKADGISCTSSLRCDNGFCSTESEVDPCGRCYTPHSKAVAAACFVDAECRSLRCGHVCGDPNPGHCKCERDEECDPDQSQYCSYEVGGDNLCHEKKAIDKGCTDRRQCISGLCLCGVCKAPNRPLAASCIGDSQCGSGQCSSEACTTGECVCDNDEDCLTTQFCKQGLLTKNTCEPLAGACGSCNNDDQCVGALICKSGKCITEHSRGVSFACCADAQCTTDKCINNVCGCLSDSQCGDGYCKNNVCTDLQEECDSGCGSGSVCASNYCTASFNGKCVSPNSLPLLASCCHNDQCLKGLCTGSVCRCDSISDCSYGQYCEKDGDDRCLPKLGFGGSCSGNEECVYGFCSSGRCVAYPKRGNGSFCYQNEDCLTDQCGVNSTCVCEIDSDCASDEYCAEPIGQAAYCADKRTVGSGCDQDAKCISGCCKGIIGFQECMATWQCD